MHSVDVLLTSLYSIVIGLGFGACLLTAALAINGADRQDERNHPLVAAALLTVRHTVISGRSQLIMLGLMVGMSVIFKVVGLPLMSAACIIAGLAVMVGATVLMVAHRKVAFA